MPRTQLDRRTLLRGAGGVAIALPFLEAMLPRHARAVTSPRRYVVCFAGMSLGRDNVGKLTDIVPDGAGATFTLRPPMEPLLPLKDDLLVVSGMKIPVGGPGGRQPSFHKSSISPMLSGSNPPNISPDCFAPTSDQLVARDPAFAGKTKYAYLPLRVQADPYRGGGNVGVISWRDKGQKNDPTVSPNLAFTNLFRGFAAQKPADAAEAAALDRLQREDATVLDLIKGNADHLRARLGRADQQRLQRHFDELRDLETRLRSIPGDLPAGCAAPPRPGDDPVISKAEASGNEVGYAGEEARAMALTSVLVKALACDLTRVATLQYTCVQCFMNVEPLVGVKMDLHELAHLSSIAGGKDVAQQKVMEMYGWHMKHFARLATLLKAETGPDGRSLLDTTVLVFVNEGGLGPGEGKNPASHSTDNMMAVVAGGRATGLKLGRHLVTDNEHPARVFTSAMNAVGVPATGLGDVPGRLEAMFSA